MYENTKIESFLKTLKHEEVYIVLVIALVLWNRLQQKKPQHLIQQAESDDRERG